MRKNTESRSTCSIGRSNQTPTQMLHNLLLGQQQAAQCINGCLAEIVQGATMMAGSIRDGHRLLYVGAGSSGLMAMADALELPGTFGIDRKQVITFLAGGAASLTHLEGSPDDDVSTVQQEIAMYKPRGGDCMICVSASGDTRYTLSAQSVASANRIPTIAIACNADSPLLAKAAVPILLETPSEAVAGSTRLGAGTAQKIVLNMMSTLMASLLGHVYDGHMVNLRVDSDKLRKRALTMIVDLSGCREDYAVECLTRANGEVKVAVLLASGCKDVRSARVRIENCRGDLGSALAELQ